MKKLGIGQTLTIIANVGVVAGLLLVAYEVKQTRDFAKIEFLTYNRLAYQEIEMQMTDPEIASVWAKSVVDPGSMTAADIRIMDAWLNSLYTYFQQQLTLEKEGLLKPGAFEREIARNIPYYYGSTFAQAYWQEVWSTGEEGAGEVAILMNKVIADSDPSSNRMYIDRIQQRIDEQITRIEE